MISLSKGKFSRGYEDQFKEEIFKIKKINTILPFPTYTLKEYDGGDEIQGNFYEFEMVPVTKELFKIQEILEEKIKNRKRFVLVKWRGYKNPTWVPKDNIQKLEV